jgi:predicted O-methyltransferase YrrM
MTTLIQPGLSSLIDRLFAEADAAEDARWPAAADARADYRQYYGRPKDQPLPVSRATGKLLYILARSIRARNIVEFGTSFGFSRLHLAAALRDSGGGRLIGSEFESSKMERARENLAAGGLSSCALTLVSQLLRRCLMLEIHVDLHADEQRPRIGKLD